MPRTWTEEQRKELAEKQKQRWAQKKAEAQETASNPIATDVIKELDAPEKPRPRLKPVPAFAQPTVLFSADALIERLRSLPLGSISYGDCGLLLNALSACSTAVALARRQKQEQLDAGTHRAPCKTCGRMIDISKSGGFQILTDYDDHRQMINVYYCSQYCLLAKNMPSHAKQTLKEKKENRA